MVAEAALLVLVAVSVVAVVGVCAEATVTNSAVLASAAVIVLANMCSSFAQMMKKKHEAAIAVPQFPEFRDTCVALTRSSRNKSSCAHFVATRKDSSSSERLEFSHGLRLHHSAEFDAVETDRRR